MVYFEDAVAIVNAHAEARRTRVRESDRRARHHHRHDRRCSVSAPPAPRAGADVAWGAPPEPLNSGDATLPDNLHRLFRGNTPSSSASPRLRVNRTVPGSIPSHRVPLAA